MTFRQFVFIAAVPAAIFAALLAVQGASAQDMNATGTGNATDNATMVQVGGGNATVQYYTFTPEVAEISAGDSVTWFNQNMFTELHTVTFVRDFNLTTDIILPFAVPDGTEFELVPPFNTGEPVTLETPNGTAVVALNKVAFYPAVIDSTGSISYPNGTDIQYTMDGTEKAVNSGIILPPFPPVSEQNKTAVGGAEVPEGQPMNATATDETGPAEEEMAIGPPFPQVNTFTVTFEEPGTYDYFCALHPWMTGQVVVS